MCGLIPGSKTFWLASYPKSGNTWIRAVFTAWVGQEQVDIDDFEGGPIASSRLHMEEALGVVTSQLRADEVLMLRPRADEVLEQEDRRSGEVRLRKVHDAFFNGPSGEAVVSTHAAKGVIYIVRDPRDVAVSFANHLGRSLERAVDLLCSRAASLGPIGADGAAEPQFVQHLGTWSEHVESWVDQTVLPVLVVRYEDFLSCPDAKWTQILEFAGLPVDPVRVRSAVEATSFSRLSALESEGGFRERPADRPFFRRGIAGGWTDSLPPELARRIEAEHGEVMARYEYL